MNNYSEKLVALCNRKDPKRVTKQCFGVPEIYIAQDADVKTAADTSFETLLRTAILKAVGEGGQLNVYVDCDDVLLDLLGPMVKVLNLAFKTEILIQEVQEWDTLGQLFGERAVGLAFRKLVPLLEPKGDALAAFKILCSKPELNVHILTAVSGEAQTDRRLSIQKWLPWFPIEKLIFERDKSKYSGGLLIDDGLHNILSYDGLRMIVDMPHNRKQIDDLRVARISSLEEALSLFPTYTSSL